MDLLAPSPLVGGASSARLDHALPVELRLREPPPYLPGRIKGELKGETSRQGGSYGQKRSVLLTAGRTLALGRGGRLLSLAGSYEQGRDYARKLRTRDAALDSSLRWSRTRAAGRASRAVSRPGAPVAGGTPASSGTLSYRLTYRGEQQALGDAALQLVPGRPEREPVVPLRPYKRIRDNRPTWVWWPMTCSCP